METVTQVAKQSILDRIHKDLSFLRKGSASKICKMAIKMGLQRVWDCGKYTLVFYGDK